jgi:hypothetical protein
MDDKSSTLNADGSSVLGVVCGAPGIGATRKFRKVLKTGRSRTYIMWLYSR